MKKSVRRWRRWGVRILIVLCAAMLLRLTGCMERLFYHPTAGEVHPPERLHDVVDLAFASADGTHLHGWFIPARPAPTDARATTVVHIHGNAGNIESHISFVDYLPRAGFNVVVFDYRSYGQSDSNGRLRREPLIADAHAAVDHVMTLDAVDPDRVIIYGQSLGGAIAQHVFADQPRVRALILESPFTSWREVAANAVGGDPPSWFGRMLASWLIHDGSRPIDASRRVAADPADQRPVLILHGLRDTIVPPSHSDRIAAVFGEQARLHSFPEGDHNSLRWDVPAMTGIVINFLGQHSGQ